MKAGGVHGRTMSKASALNRRRFIQTTATAALTTPWLSQAAAAGPFQATGTRVGEVTDTTAIVWTRLTQAPARNNQGVMFDKLKKTKGGKEPQQPVPPAHEIEGACPAASGKVRVRYGLKEDLSDAVETPWVEVSAEKVLVSPTPLVGPDRVNKRDNHSNEAFMHEGNEIRSWLQSNVPDNFFVVCGDRHWQYHSVHPTAGVQEFSVGPASNSHASGSPGEDKTYHKFHRVKGGFLCVELHPNGAESEIAFQLRDVDGAVGYEAKFKRRVA